MENSANEEASVPMADFLFGVHPLLLIVISIVTLFVCSAIYVIQSGLLAKIEVKAIEPERGSLVVAYKVGHGPYSGAGEIFTDVCSLLLTREHIGIYYDDPEAVSPADLRYAVGVILAESPEEPKPEELELMTQHGYKIIHFPKPNHVVQASFPFKNTLSIYMGIFRVYPKLKEYIAERGLCAYPALEIYTSSSIEFIMPLSKQEEFFVPEFQEDQVSIATTEFSNHPDHASVDEDLKKKVDEKVFVKPKTPSPKREEVNDDDQEEESSSSDDDKKSEASIDEDSSEFEKVEPENLK